MKEHFFQVSNASDAVTDNSCMVISFEPSPSMLMNQHSESEEQQNQTSGMQIFQVFNQKSIQGQF